MMVEEAAQCHLASGDIETGPLAGSLSGKLIGRKLSRYCKMLNCPTDFLRPGDSNSKAMAHEALSLT